MTPLNLVLLGASALAAAATCLPGQAVWTPHHLAASPPARAQHAMAHDTARGRIVLFGGRTPSLIVLADTWEWDGRAWTRPPQRQPVRPPPPGSLLGARSGHALAYDAARGRTVLFGGRRPPSTVRLGDTWDFDGGGWTRRSPAASPPARSGHAMVHDAARREVVLFGGRHQPSTSVVLLDDTWAWNGTTWIQRTPAARPSPRARHALAYDAGRGRVVLFGGETTSGPSNETWEWDGSNWAMHQGSNPPARSEAAMVHDGARRVTVLFGGRNASGALLADLWEWDGVRWTQAMPAGGPVPRAGHAMAFDPARACALLFGGHDSAPSALGDTWEYGTFAKNGVELLVNGDFETGNMTGWSSSRPPAVGAYGTAAMPSVAFGKHIGGGTYLARTGVAGQSFDLSARAADIDAGRLDLEVSGFLGTSDANRGSARVRTIFFSALKQQLGSFELGPVTWSEVFRDSGPNLVWREQLLQIPAGTRSMMCELLLSQAYAYADSLSAKLAVREPPKPQPLDRELIVNGGFEELQVGQAIARKADGWSLSRGSGYGISLYGGHASFPSLAHGQLIGGGNQLPNFSWGIRLYQTLDLRGNAAEVDAGSLEVVLAGYLGMDGVQDSTAGAWSSVSFKDALGRALGKGALSTVFPQTGMQTILLRREGVFAVPPGARSMQVDVSKPPTSRYNSWFDNISATLRKKVPPKPLPYDTELLVNGDFELGRALSITRAGGWQHEHLPFDYGIMTVVGYGTRSRPSPAFARQIGGGTYLASTDTSRGNSTTTQRFDLTANAADVDAGIAGVHLAGWFGSVNQRADGCWLEASFYDGLSRLLGSTQIRKPWQPGTHFATAGAAIPKSTRTLVIALRMQGIATWLSAGEAWADNLSAVLFDMRKGPGKYPGIGEDLLLLSGVNAPPTGGPGHDVKKAAANDVLTLRLLSPGGGLVGGIPLLLADPFPTGKPPKGLLPGLHVGPGHSILWFGAWRQGPFGPEKLRAAGNEYVFLIPPGLRGSVMLQGTVISAKAKNGFLAAADAHELRF